MRAGRLIPALCAFFVLAVGVAACGSGVSGDSVADMAGNPITTQAFNHWMYIAAKGNTAQSPGAPVIVPNDPPGFDGCVKQVRAQIPQLSKTPDKQIKAQCKQLFTSLSTQVMDFLIKAYWYQADAHKLNIKVSDKQVQQAFQAAKRQQFPTDSAFQTFLSQSGQTLQDILFRVRVNQIYRKLLAKESSTVTQTQIAAYYKAHTSQFGTPEARDIRLIRTNAQGAAQAARKALDSGQSWQQVAARYTVDAATKAKGGLLQGITRGQEEQVLDKALFSAPPGKVQGPIHGTFGFYVFEVTRIKPGTQQSLTKATPLIRQILQSQAQQSSQTNVESRARKNWLKKTKCRSEFAMADCAGYKPPKNSALSLPGASQVPQTPQTPQTPQQAPSSGP